MKSKDKKELKTRTVVELKSMLKDAKDVLFSLKLEKEQNKLKDLRAIFHKRKEIARILTAIRGKEI